MLYALILLYVCLYTLYSNYLLRSPHFTTEIFKELKRNREDVDLAKALAAGCVDAALEEEEESGAGAAGNAVSVWGKGLSEDDAVKSAVEMLKLMPGIDSKNIYKVINNVNCISDLVGMTEQQLVPLIGPINATKLYNFLNNRYE